MRRLGRGFSCIEVIVALALVALALAALAPALLQCAALMADARVETYSAALAITRMEQLSALAYEQRAGPPGDTSDFSTNLAVDPPDDAGDGLQVGAPDSVWRDRGTRFDYADALGGLLSTSSPDSWFTRRWAVVPLTGSGADTLLVQVLAAARARDVRGSARTDTRHRPGDVWLFTVRPRGAQ